MVVTDWYMPPTSRYYKKGVFKPDADAPILGDMVPNHAAVLLGWGTTKENENYWILRNSFGTDFGQKGDMLVERGSFGIGLSTAGFDVEYA